MAISVHIYSCECDDCFTAELSNALEDRADFVQRFANDGWYFSGYASNGIFDTRLATCPECTARDDAEDARMLAEKEDADADALQAD